MDYSDVTLILPTLNEKKTAPLIVRDALAKYNGISIIVVDDGSIDGTREEIRKITKARESVLLLDRSTHGIMPGLTGSIIHGMERSETRYTVVMDADMQHPPKKIAEIVADLRDGYQIVVCVRAVVKDWPLSRKVVSKILGYMGYAVLALNRKKMCGDIFSGYFGVETRTAIKLISKNRKRFVDNGYKFLFDMLKCIDVESPTRIKDIPYSFGNRRFGTSKAGPSQALALLRSFLS